MLFIMEMGQQSIVHPYHTMLYNNGRTKQISVLRGHSLSQMAGRKLKAGPYIRMILP